MLSTLHHAGHCSVDVANLTSAVVVNIIGRSDIQNDLLNGYCFCTCFESPLSTAFGEKIARNVEMASGCFCQVSRCCVGVHILLGHENVTVHRL